MKRMDKELMFLPRLPFGKVLQISSSLMTLLLAMKIHNLTCTLFDNSNLFTNEIIKEAIADTTNISEKDPKKLSKQEKKEGWSSLLGEKKDNCLKDNQCSYKDHDTTVEKAEDKLQKDILKNKIDIENEEKKIKYQKDILDTAQKNIDKKINSLDKKIFYLNGIESERNATMQADIDKLVKIYEQMPPREAASVFNIMDLHVLVSVVNKMNPRKTSSIMGYMMPERVNLVSQYMAGIRSFRNVGLSSTKEENFLSLSRNPKPQ